MHVDKPHKPLGQQFPHPHLGVSKSSLVSALPALYFWDSPCVLLAPSIKAHCCTGIHSKWKKVEIFIFKPKTKLSMFFSLHSQMILLLELKDLSEQSSPAALVGFSPLSGVQFVPTFYFLKWLTMCSSYK